MDTVLKPKILHAKKIGYKIHIFSVKIAKQIVKIQ